MELKTPLGWSIKQIKDLGKCVTGTTPKTNEPKYYSSCDYDFISPADLGNSKYIYSSKKQISREGLEVSRSVPRNSVLCVCIGSSIGKVGLSWHQESCTNQQINSIICSNSCDPEFIYYLLLYYSHYWKSFATFSTVPILNKGRFEEITIPVCDDIEEQRKIAAVLSLVQDALAQQKQIITLTTELKKALMHKLFTEGTGGEPQKITEIDLIPENWDVVPLDNLLILTQYGLSVKGGDSGKYPILRMTNQVDGKIVSKNLQYVDTKQYDFEKFKVEYGDILFNRTNSFELVGRTAIFDIDGDFVFASYLIRLRTNKEKLNPFFLNHYFNWDKTQIRLKGIATRAVSQSNISASRLKGFIIPLPKTLEEQDKIVKSLDYCDYKIAVQRQKCNILNDLFCTLLHQLMTAQIRVDDLNLSALNLELQGGDE